MALAGRKLMHYLMLLHLAEGGRSDGPDPHVEGRKGGSVS